MGKVKEILNQIERNKGKVAKFFIVCATLKFFSSTLYRIYSIRDSRTQIETTINIYCLLIIGIIFLHEFLKCFLCNFMLDNLKVLTHYKGKGITFTLISLIYMSHSMDTQQKYSGYLLFFVGIILFIIDYNFKSEKKKSPYELALERSKNKVQRSNLEFEPEIVVEVSNNRNDSTELSTGFPNAVEIKNPASSANPYDIPDDF